MADKAINFKRYQKLSIDGKAVNTIEEYKKYSTGIKVTGGAVPRLEQMSKTMADYYDQHLLNVVAGGSLFYPEEEYKAPTGFAAVVDKISSAISELRSRIFYAWQALKGDYGHDDCY